MKEMIMSRSEMTEGAIWKNLLYFFFPILLGAFFQQLYNTADAIIVGQFIGKEALSAVGGTTGTLINLLVGFFMGLSSGATVIISQYYGGKKEDKVKEAVHTAMGLAILAGTVIMLIGLILAPLVLKLMGTPQDILGYSLIYIRIYFLGMVPNLVYNMGAGILRAVGDSKRPLYFLIASCFINVVLDYVFVALFKMDIMGAGIATVISQIISGVLVVYILMHTKDSYRLSLKEIKLHPALLQKILQIGLPTGIQSVMYSFSNIFIQSNINAFGTNTIAAWTAYSKIDGIFWMIMTAFGVSITTFVGQNYGAGKNERMKKGVKVCMVLTMSTAIGMSVLLYFAGEIPFRLFTSETLVIQSGLSILHFLVPTYFTYVCIEVLAGALRGIGDSLIPMLITCIGICVLRMIWLFVAVPLCPNTKTVILSYPITWSVTSLCFIIYYKIFSKMRTV